MSLKVISNKKNNEPKTLKDIWLGKYSWSKSRPRTIDDQTLTDLLGVIQYECYRSEMADIIGIRDDGSSDCILFDYVLDALNAPDNEDVREAFEELFYGNIVLGVNPEEFDAERALEMLKTLAEANGFI